MKRSELKEIILEVQQELKESTELLNMGKFSVTQMAAGRDADGKTKLQITQHPNYIHVSQKEAIALRKILDKWIKNKFLI